MRNPQYEAGGLRLKPEYWQIIREAAAAQRRTPTEYLRHLIEDTLDERIASREEKA